MKIGLNVSIFLSEMSLNFTNISLISIVATVQLSGKTTGCPNKKGDLEILLYCICNEADKL